MSAAGPLLCLLLAGDALPAGWLLARLHAAEAAYAHAEADYRLAHRRNGRAERDTSEQYAGSRGGGFRAVTAPADRPDAAAARLLNGVYLATAVRIADGWATTAVGPPPADPPDTGYPHAPAGLPDDRRTFRDHLARRTGRVAVAATAGGWVARFPVPGPAGEPSLVTLTLSAGPPAVVTTVRTTQPAGGCDLDYGPTDAGGWPTLRTVRLFRSLGGSIGLSERVAEFARFDRRPGPPPADRLTLGSLGLPEPAFVPAELTGFTPPPAPAPPAADAPPWVAIAGIVLLGAVAFVRVGRNS